MFNIDEDTQFNEHFTSVKHALYALHDSMKSMNVNTVVHFGALDKRIVLITDPYNNVGCFTIVVGLTSSQLDVAYTEMKSVRNDMRKMFKSESIKNKSRKACKLFNIRYFNFFIRYISYPITTLKSSYIYACIYIYLFHTQSTHIGKSYMNSNTILHRINDKYMIMLRYITVNRF